MRIDFTSGLLRILRTVLCLVLVAALTPSTTFAASLIGVSDPLETEWLLRADDLVAVNPFGQIGGAPPFPPPVTDTTARWWVLETEDGKVSVENDANTIINVGCAATNPFESPFPQQTRVGRFFDLDHDVVVTLAPTANADGDGCPGSSNMAVYAQDAQGDPNSPTTLSVTATTISPANWIQSTVGDFNRDNFDDLFVISPEGAFIATANDVSDPSQGFMLTMPVAIALARTPMTEPTVGDLDRDGNLEVIWNGALDTLGAELKVYFATVCAGPSAEGVCAEAATFDIIQDPLSADPIPLTNVVVGGICTQDGNAQFSDLPSATALAAGNYLASTGDELIVVATVTDLDDPFNHCKSTVFLYDFNSSDLSPILLDTLQNLGSVTLTALVSYASKARFQWFGTRDQAVVAQGGIQAPSALAQFVSVLTFDENTNKMRAHTRKLNEPGSFQFLQGMAVGRFSGPPDEDASAADFDPQVALMLKTFVLTFPDNTIDDSTSILIFDVDAEDDNFTPTQVQSFRMRQPTVLLNLQNRGGSMLRSGDVAGRGFKLGAPLFIRINEAIQTDVVVAQPPMHAAWLPMLNLAPADLSPLNQFSACNQESRTITGDTFCLVNFSVAPGGFSSKFNTTITQSNQSETTDSTSYTFGLKESVAIKTGTSKFGKPVFGTLQNSLKISAEQTYENNFEAKFGVNTTTSFNVSTATSFSDVVWYTRRAYKLYFYPILGQTACPEDEEPCDPADEQPLVIMLSGPEVVTTSRGDGRSLELYQPVHEPNAIFTYPPTCAQLANRYGADICKTETNNSPRDLLRSTGQFRTDTSTSSFSASWSVQTEERETAGSSQNYSFDLSETLTVGAPKLFSGAEFTGSLEYNESTAISTSLTNTTKLGESTGIAGSKSAEFLNPGLFEYPIEGYIFGNPLPETVVELPVDAQVKSTGVLRFIYRADPTDTIDGGSWWTTGPYATNIDVGLNRPYSFSEAPGKLETGDNSKITQCRAKNPADHIAQCIRANPPVPEDLWNSQFYWLRGLLITQQGEIAGPQQSWATVGDVMTLSVRVYNMSLRDMDQAGVDRIVVRFYGQRVDVLKSPVGDSFFIGETTLDPLPGFNSSRFPVTPNWSLASVNFDTTNHEDEELIFWVVVYATDFDGTMVEELPGYGLREKPPIDPEAIASIADIDIETVELFDTNGESTTTSVANNVAFYHRVFYVEPAVAASEEPTSEGDLELEALAIVSGDTARLGDRVIVRADLKSREHRSLGTEVRFFDGDPDDPESRVFDWELLPIIRADGMSRAEVPYSTAECGHHEIVVIADNGNGQEPVTARSGIDFPCEIDVVDSVGKAKAVASRKFRGKLKLDMRFDPAATGLGTMNLDQATVTVDCALCSKGTELVIDSRRNPLSPISASANRKSKPDRAVYRTTAGKSSVKVKVKRNTKRGKLKMVVKKARLTAPECSGGTTALETRLVFSDGNPENTTIVSLVDDWKCVKRKDRGQIKKPNGKKNRGRIKTLKSRS